MFKEYIAYLKDNPKGYWFKAKLYGWGWVPVKWQGWIVVLICVASPFPDSTLGKSMTRRARLCWAFY